MDDITRTVALEGAIETYSLDAFALRVTEGPCKGVRERFDQRKITIGSAPDNDMALDDGTVSRFHCVIEASASGYALRDLESKNGTSVNDVKVTKAFLAPGQVIKVGETVMVFEASTGKVDVSLSKEDRFGRLLGGSVEMREIFAILERVAPTDATVLIEGESGTGKELVAEGLHTKSRREDGPFVVFDCSAVPKDLIESELFGHVKGAFTGAVASREGAFLEADGGTLFLDEIGELTSELQPKLLRVLEKGEVKPVGADRHVRANVRIVAATNRNLKREVKAGAFREDLFYRLAVIRIQMPPLRKRTEDVPMLVDAFLDELSKTMGQPKPSISYDTMMTLKQHPWRGNVRELKNFLERAMLLAEEGKLESKFLGSTIIRMQSGDGVAERTPASGSGNHLGLDVDLELPFKDAKARLLETFELRYWERMLERHGWNVSQAAKSGGVHRKSLEYLVRKLDLSRPER